MKVLVFGAGAVGSAVGGFLKKAGCEVYFLGRQHHMDAIEKRGLRITGIWGDYLIENIKTFTSVDQVEKENFDVVVLSVKSFDTDTAISQLKNTQAKLYVSFQNGLGNVEKLEKAFGSERSAGARVIFGAELVKPGEVKITVEADKVAIGPLWEPVNSHQKKLIQELVHALNEGGIGSFYTENVIGHLWSKVLYNAPLNPLSAAFRVPYGKLLEMEYTKNIMREVIREGHAVARSELRELIPWKSPEEYIELFENKLVPSTSAHYASMVGDLWKKGKTEIESINGEVVRRGAASGISCPVNGTLLSLIKTLESLLNSQFLPDERKNSFCK